MENNCNVTSRPRNIKELLKSWYLWKPFLAIVIGGIAGFVIFYFVSCDTRVCIISGSTYSTIITGSFLGLLLTNSPCLKCSTVKK
jgi:hypothetical protein